MPHARAQLEEMIIIMRLGLIISRVINKRGVDLFCAFEYRCPRTMYLWLRRLHFELCSLRLRDHLMPDHTQDPRDPSSSRTPSPMIIGVAGGTGSGKTTAARKIVASLPAHTAAVIQHDWYYHDNSRLSLKERQVINFDEPDALDNNLLCEHLKHLKQGGTVECPQYDFGSHSRRSTTLTILPGRIIVVEGILLFAIPELRDIFDLRIFIDTDSDIRLMRRIKRDILERDRTIESIQRQYYNTVRPMHKRHVAPSKRYAHLIIPEGGENKAALDVVIGKLLYVISQPPVLIDKP